MNTPLFLVSNDDGVAATGIQTLAKTLSSIGEVIVVAPASDQSAVSHSMSLRKPLRLVKHADWQGDLHPITVYAVDGTPTDSVYMAVNHILKDRKPDLVVSGINHGANLGNDVLYSGTVSAALEGVLMGIPGVALSQVGTHSLDFAPGADFAKELILTLLANPAPTGILLNVNIPKRITQTGYAVTYLGQHQYLEEVQERVDPRGQPYYWIGGQWGGYQDLPGTDCKAIAEGLISVTPIEIQFTSKRHLQWVAKLPIRQYKSLSLFENYQPA